MTEIWRDIPGFSNYQVSNLGRVKSLRWYRTPNEKILKLSLRGRLMDYQGVTIYSDMGTPVSVKISRLVASVFIGSIPEGMQVNHKDGNKQNDRVTNLEIVTASENIRHAFDTGLNRGLKGSMNGMWGRTHTPEARARISRARKLS